ncbi:MAG: Tetratricopeptide 2 repeat protein [Firmicutes bacterium]|nr:Tetratricopeptide 2 repeat protein [Bacillota bacterium]
MELMATLPEQPLAHAGRVIVLEAAAGSARREQLQRWVDQARDQGARSCLLNLSWHEGGPWAGITDLFASLMPEIQADAPDLIAKHDYELTSVLPMLRHTIPVRARTLTDTANSQEKVRNYPADRANRIVQGLIQLLDSFFARRTHPPLAIACDDFDQASTLGRLFITDLLRRRGERFRLSLLVAAAPGAGEATAGQFAAGLVSGRAHLDLPPDAADQVDPVAMARLAEATEASMQGDLIAREALAPKAIHYWLKSGQPERAFELQLWAFGRYTEVGYYADALPYGIAAKEHMKPPVAIKLDDYWTHKMYFCLVSVGRVEEALAIVEGFLERTNDPHYLMRPTYLISMLYCRFLPDRDLARAEAYLEQGLAYGAQLDLPETERVYNIVFNRNGLALVRHRQKRFQDALDLCRTGYEQMNRTLPPDSHRLHRSVLVFNMAQVYSAMGLYQEAVAHYSEAIAMDPNYSEYHNDRGSLYLKLGRHAEALDDFVQAIQLSPPYPEVLGNLGQCYRLLGRMADAVRAYSECLDLAPAEPIALVGRAEAYEALGQADLALRDYDAALAINPGHVVALTNRAILSYDAGRLSDALNDLNRAIAVTPDNLELYSNRAVVLSDLALYAEAMRDIGRYLEADLSAEERSEAEQRMAAVSAKATG